MGADRTLEITLDGHHARYHLHRSLRSPRLAEVSAVDVPSLLQVPHVSTRVADGSGQASRRHTCPSVDHRARSGTSRAGKHRTWPTLVTHRDRLVHEWLKRRRFDPIVTYWSTTSDLASALDTALKRLPGPVIVSVDVAADAEGPHRRPVQLLVLAQGGSLAGPGMLPVLSADEAHEAEWRGRTFLAGDPLQVLWNLESAAGADAAVWALADLATAVTVRRSATGSTAARMAASRR